MPRVGRARVRGRRLIDLCFTHLIGEPLDQDGDQEVKEHVVAEGHEGDEVERRPMTRVLHPGEEHDVPVLLRQDLRTRLKIIPGAGRVRFYCTLYTET